MPRLRDLGEFEAIRRLVHGLGEEPGVVVGSGDDAAVLRPRASRDLVVTTDAFVEGRHWLAEWISPGELGARLAAANLSDLAAMAAAPRWAVVAIGARADQESEIWLAFQSGLVATLADHGAALVGGNLGAVDGATWVALTLIGEVERGCAWTRHAARPGDLVAVTGWPGRAAAGMRLARERATEARDPAWGDLVAAWTRPTPRVALAHRLAATGAVTAAIDVSDGILGDLQHLCEASGVGADLDRLGPGDPLLERAAAALGTSAEELRRGPSDDYELLVAIDPAGLAACAQAASDAQVPWTVLGTLSSAPESITLDRDGQRGAIEPSGYDHFA